MIVSVSVVLVCVCWADDYLGFGLLDGLVGWPGWLAWLAGWVLVWGGCAGRNDGTPCRAAAFTICDATTSPALHQGPVASVFAGQAWSECWLLIGWLVSAGWGGGWQLVVGWAVGWSGAWSAECC